MDDTEQELMKALGMQENLNKDFVAKAKGDGTSPFALKEEIIEALKTVSDPEILISIYDLGLVYNIIQGKNGDVVIEMTLTTPMCPVAGELPQQAADAIAQIKGVNNVDVKLVWEPAWTPERMSDEAKAMLDMF